MCILSFLCLLQMRLYHDEHQEGHLEAWDYSQMTWGGSCWAEKKLMESHAPLLHAKTAAVCHQCHGTPRGRRNSSLLPTLLSTRHRTHLTNGRKIVTWNSEHRARLNVWQQSWPNGRGVGPVIRKVAGRIPCQEEECGRFPVASLMAEMPTSTSPNPTRLYGL